MGLARSDVARKTTSLIGVESGWPLLQLLMSLALFAPVLALVVTAFGDTGGIMGHLVDTVLGRYLTTTVQLMAGVALVALVFGVSSAWLVSRYDFPLRGALEWMLVLPAAVPAYIIAYTYTDFLEYAGPVQTAIRHLFGYTTSRQYYFPEIRSLGGAMLVMGAVLYPYVYVATRTAFRLTSTRLFEAARLAGGNIFTTIALPLARPAIVAGLALVMMEVVSDFGTVEYFALDTLTLGIFNVWLGMGNMAAAARIALLAFVLVVALLGLERWARSGRNIANEGRGQTGVPQIKVTGWRGTGLMVLGLIPIALGFVIPVAVLSGFVLSGLGAGAPEGTFAAIKNTVLVAGVSSLLIMVMAVVIGVIARYRAGRLGAVMAGVSSSGYAVPGTILAIGVLGCVYGIDALARQLFGVAVFGLLTGSLVVLVFAYLVRFQAVGYGMVQAGLNRIPPNIMPASQVMGHGFVSSVTRVVLPLLRPSFLAGLLVAFVDIMKELPMTLLLSPFNFETLATITYQYAKDEMLEEAALPALMIVLAGLIPVVIINRSLSARRHSFEANRRK
ncbi:MAG: iron ABC transporter permease [Alphaproteobacteria bacterium]|nr:iron ABC transporter permease [Alphaproteobacteria bacterium]